ncbi:MAG: archaea-specific SMC-related protein [Halanaeroarchaeum sp.]
MSAPPAGSPTPARVSAKNVGGIDETTVTLEPGITVLSGRNATNRTSFLRALIAALGGSDVSLKADADEGKATLEFDEERYVRTLQRANGRVRLGGEPYLADGQTGDLFAFLLEENEARQAVIRGEDLREIIMRPVDKADIEEQIESLSDRKRAIDRELDRIDDLKDRKTELVERRARLERELRETEDALEEKRSELEGMDRPLAESKDIENELDEALEDLQATRGDLEDVEFRIETERESLEALRSEREEVRDDLDSLSADPDADLETVTAEIERLRERKRSLESTTSQLQRIIQFNRQMLQGDQEEVREMIDRTPDEVTRQLVDDVVVCWTCGSEVETSNIEETVALLQDLREEKASERNEVQATLEAKTDRKSELERTRRRRERLEDRLADVEREIEDREATIESLTERRSDLEDRVESLEARVDELEAEEHGEVLAVHRDVNELEFERDRLESDIDEVDGEIESIEAEIDRVADLEAEREEVTDELTDLRTRIERLEREAVEAFNDHMQAILDVLEYDNVERIWIERSEEDVRRGRETVTEGVFALHVVRSNEDGVTYEDTVEHLSESEREVTGLVFALAGYLVHEVYERLPFMVLDSLEAIDSDRIARLVEYFESYPTYLVVALLPEDAAAIDVDHHRVTEV